MRRSAVFVAALLLAPLAIAGTSRLATGTATGDGSKAGALGEAFSGGMYNHCDQSEELVLKETSVSCTDGGDRWVCKMSYKDTCAESEGQKSYLIAGYGQGERSDRKDAACAQAKERALNQECREQSYRRDRKTDHDVGECQCGEVGSTSKPEWMCFAEYRVSCAKEEN